MERPTTTHRLNDFFLTMARRSLGELGVNDANVVNYVAALMTDFARADRLYALGQGATAFERTTRTLDATGATAKDRRSLLLIRELRKHVGDYALFMSGLFRTHVETRGALDHYFEEGRRSYRLVSELDVALLRTGFLFFQHLSEHFEFYSGALDYMRRVYFAPLPGRSPFAEFLEQVEGWIMSGLSAN